MDAERRHMVWPKPGPRKPVRVPKAGCAAACVVALLATGYASRHAGAEAPGGAIMFVRGDAEGTGDGTSWENAFTDLQDALENTTGSTQIWVARGIYYPGTLRATTFQLIDDVQIFGGLAGTEDPQSFDLAARNFDNHETVLDGSLGTPSNGDDVFHVVTGSNTTPTAVLDGFTITGGHANGLTATKQDVGGGMLIVDGSPTIRNCLFLGNRAGTEGGALHIERGSPTLINCTFVDNHSTTSQGSNNRGGAVYSVGEAGRVAAPTLINCLFAGNRAGVGGGGSGGAFYHAASSGAKLINCTFHRNVADSNGGGVYYAGGSLTLTNCILWLNLDNGGADASAQIFGSARASYSCVQGSFPGTGNIDLDPLFADPVGPDGQSGTRDDDLRLSAGSPCIDAADSGAVPAGVTKDLDGAPRFVNDPNATDTGEAATRGAVVDMGAYEFLEPCSNDTDCNDSEPCTIDRCDTATGQCAYETVDCNDGLFCNGDESCAGGGCRPGSPPDCNDGVVCTIDSCDESAGACVHRPDHAACDNGFYCDGLETCHVALGCQAGVAIDCDDGVVCTIDACDETADSCNHDPNDAVCGDGRFCNGAEICDSTAGCQTGAAPCSAQTVCDEALTACVGCVLDGDCEDGDVCTADRCDTGVCQREAIADCCETANDCEPIACMNVECVDGVCERTTEADDTPCPDDLFCNGVETCRSGVCTGGSAPCAIGERCDERTDVCVPTLDCRTDVDCDDRNPCTDDACVHAVCTRTNRSIPCNDGDDCTSQDVCSNGVCAGTPIIGCGEPPNPDSDGDGVPDANDRCPNTPPAEAPNARGCSCSQIDGDNDGVNDCVDQCPADASKIEPGLCGCGVPDTDADIDGVANCADLCPNSPIESQVDADGCPLDVPPEQPTPTEPGEGDDTDPGLDAVDDGTVQTTNVADAVVDVPAEAPVGVASPTCGACGALGLISWLGLLFGLFGLRAKSIGSA